MPVFSSGCWVSLSKTVDGNVHTTNVVLCFDSAEALIWQTTEQKYKWYKMRKTCKNSQWQSVYTLMWMLCEHLKRSQGQNKNV